MNERAENVPLSAEVSDPLTAAVLGCAHTIALPDGTEKATISLRDLKCLSDRHQTSMRTFERIALQNGILPERYLRNFSYLDCAEQLLLHDAHVLLIGLGGLGGHVLDLLARMGIGTITGVDGDTFAESNLNRQILAKESTLNVPKPQAAADYVASVNSSVSFIGIHEYLSGEKLKSVCLDKTIIVDALGGLRYRTELEKAASSAGVPLVSAVIAGLSGYVTTVFPGETGPAELLGTGASVEDLLGTPSPVVACAASMQCAEVMRIVTGRTRMRGVLFFDLADRSFQNVMFDEI